MERIRAEYGRIDAIVTAAGHYQIMPVSEITRVQWTRMLRVHLGGALNLIRAVVPEMKARGEGSIVCVTSELAIGGGDGDAHYAAAKGGDHRTHPILGGGACAVRNPRERGGARADGHPPARP